MSSRRSACVYLPQFYSRLFEKSRHGDDDDNDDYDNDDDDDDDGGDMVL